MEDPIENKLKAITHPTRRMIIISLAERGPLSYTDLMRLSGTRDSGTFAFHLRNLKGLVRKNEYGDYELTEEGWNTYKALKALEGRTDIVEKRPVQEKKIDETPRLKIGEETVTISDRISFEITPELLMKLKRENKKLIVTDVITLNIHHMEPELLDEVLEGITDIVIVNVPRNLKNIIELKATDVAIIKAYEGETPKSNAFFGGFTGFLGSLIGGILSSILGQISGVGFSQEPKQKIEQTLDFEETKDITIDISTMSSKVSVEDNERMSTKLESEFWVKEKNDYNIEKENGEVKVSLKGGRASLKIPEHTKTIFLKAKSGVIETDLEKPEIGKLDFEGISSILKLKLKNLKNSVIDINMTSSTMNSILSFNEFQGDSTINIQAVSSYFTLILEVPDKVAVKVDIDTPSSAIIVEGDGQKSSSYVDPNYYRSDSKIDIIGTAKSSAGKIVIKRI